MNHADLVRAFRAVFGNGMTRQRYAVQRLLADGARPPRLRDGQSGPGSGS